MKKYELVVGILTYNRGSLLTTTVESFLQAWQQLAKDQMKLILYDNGSDPDHRQVNERLCQKYGMEYRRNPVIMTPQTTHEEKDRQIAQGHHGLIAGMLEYESRMYLILEDDWACEGNMEPALWQSLLALMEANPHWGQLRLRACAYDGSLTGYSVTNFVTKEKIQWSRIVELGDRQVKIGNLHWVNNPALVSRQALQRVSARFDDEIACMEHFAKDYPDNAQLTPGLFRHIGPWRKRDDLIEKGYVTDETDGISPI